MKTLIALIAVGLFTLSSFGQQLLKLKIVRGADQPNTQTEQYYLLEVTNTTNYTEFINVTTENVQCSNINPADQVNMQRELYDKTQTNPLQQDFPVNAQSTELFYVKIIRQSGISNNKWNCVRVKATAKNNEYYSNKIIIESLIPNPSNNN